MYFKGRLQVTLITMQKKKKNPSQSHNPSTFHTWYSTVSCSASVRTTSLAQALPGQTWDLFVRSLVFLQQQSPVLGHRREATLLSAWNSYVSQPQTSPSGWWRRAERPQVLSLLHSDSDLATPQIQFSPQMQSLVLSLWYSLSFLILRYVTEIKIQTGVQQGVQWRCGDQHQHTTYWKPLVYTQTPCSLLFSKCAAETWSPALSQCPNLHGFSTSINFINVSLDFEHSML